MADFVVAMVGSAIVEEVVSRAFSFMLDRRKEEVPREHCIDRLEMAHSELKLAIERSDKFPITDVALLCRRKVLKHALKECGDVLIRSQLRVLEDDEEMEQRATATDSSFSKRIAHATKSSFSYLFTKKKFDLCFSDVRRFERFADYADRFMRDLESGCSLHHYSFCNPLVRQLLEGKTLKYERVQGNRLRDVYIWPICLEERGIEVELSYRYEDFKMPEKSFLLRLVLRLSESTNILGIAMESLQCLATHFKLIAESAMRELTLLFDLHEISHSYAPPWVGIQESHALLSQVCRPDPLCCKPNRHGTSAQSKFPEQVISISFQCYDSAVDSNLHGSIDEAGRNNVIGRSPPLILRAGFAPHGMWDFLTQRYEIKKSFAGKGELRHDNIQQEIEMVRSRTIDCLVHQPELAFYTTLWQYAHGFAFFNVRTSSPDLLVYPTPPGYCNGKSRAKRSKKLGTFGIAHLDLPSSRTQTDYR